MRVLIVTPWFPNTANPMNGLFVQRDAEMFARQNQVVVLHLVPPNATTLIPEGHPGYRVLSQPFQFNNPASVLRAAETIRRLSKEADVVNSVSMNVLIATYLAGIKKPWVHTEHQVGAVSKPKSLRMSVGRSVTKRFFSYPDEVVAVGQELADAIDLHREGTTHVIGNYVRVPKPDLLSQKTRDFANSSEIKLVAVGRAVETKGVLQTVEAIAQLKDRGYNATLKWAGSGAQLEEAKALATGLGVGDKVDFLGFVEPTDLQQLLLDSDIFVLPSVHETFGIAHAEAMTHGLPAVASGKGPHTDFLLPESSVILEERTGEAIADAVQKLVNDPALPTPQEIAEYAAKRFDESVRGSRYQEIFDGLSRPGGSTMIFHALRPLDRQAAIGSRIRPVKMHDAFTEAGYTVFDIVGDHKTRRRRIKEARKMIRQGWRPDFVYSESSTWPTGLGEKITRHASLTRDLKFLAHCRKNAIPTGLFYRDVYWKFWKWSEVLRSPLKLLSRWRYGADLRAYRRSLDVVFLPSLPMAAYLPKFLRGRAVALPPGADIVQCPLPLDQVALLYVGGVGDHYSLDQTVATVTDVAGVELTICCRENEWNSVKDDYAQALAASEGRVRVRHASGEDLKSLYDEANVALLFFEPTEYRSFAAPVKMFEYLAHGKPIIASEGTLVAQFVQETGAGWVIPYTQQALKTLLEDLAGDLNQIKTKAETARAVARDNTWLSRAKEAAKVLKEG